MWLWHSRKQHLRWQQLQTIKNCIFCKKYGHPLAKSTLHLSATQQLTELNKWQPRSQQLHYKKYIFLPKISCSLSKTPTTTTVTWCQPRKWNQKSKTCSYHAATTDNYFIKNIFAKNLAAPRPKHPRQARHTTISTHNYHLHLMPASKIKWKVKQVHLMPPWSTITS